MNRLDLAVPKRDPKVCIISAWNDAYKPIADIAVPNFEAYAKKRGYGLRFYPGEFHLDPSRLETYGDKVKHTLYYDVAGQVDIVMWLDIDSLFMNFDRSVDDVLHKHRFVWTYDDNGPLSGLWIARTDELTEKHLRYAYELAARENNVRHGVIEPNGISDQDAMRRIMNVPPFRETFVNCVPAAFNGHCYAENYRDGKWIVTFPGVSFEEKLALMKEWRKKADAANGALRYPVGRGL